ncbi:hypothetical protein [Parasitella parasitica]|uniref:Pheromone-processing carboxypeptidase KEX1 n=1 Tax=Parasitella parasitica TaxID=35722 RepID=A0A0B7NLX1_9FUNG|nr:hypothetical protein [Parasitella parasitica]
MRGILYGLLVLSSISFISTLEAEDYKVTSLPGIDVDSLNFTQYAGHIEISSETDSNLFFWMIEREIASDNEKLIIWLNGGPGCSSMDGLFLENGPFRVNPDLSLAVNEGGWQNYATNIFVDQPVGTGFSFANTDSYMHNMSQITEEFVTFMDKIFITFPHLAEQDIYIAGESFAGTYIPYFAARLLELKKYNLKGIAIGNGWISAEHQYNAYYDYSVQNSLIDKERLPLVSARLKTCQDDIREKETIHHSSCERVLTDIIDSSTHENKASKKTCINMYDIRSKEEPYPECGLSWPYELDDVTKYLRLPEVKSAVHADKQILGWKECTSMVSSELHGDQSQPAYYLLPGILEEIPVLLFSGEYDLICNYIGTEYLIGNMTWNGSKGFSKDTTKEVWRIDNKLAGYYTQERNLIYVLIKDGSHMVPYDRPIECLDMINRFIEVGDNVVKGRLSQVGNSSVPIATTATATKSVPTPSLIAPSSTMTEKDTNSQDKSEQEQLGLDDRWSQYYNWGTSTLVIVILFAFTLCFCWCRNNKRPSGSAAHEFGGAPQREREGVYSKKRGFFGLIQGFFGNGKSSNANRRTFRLGDNDESNELDELVIETPTLFEANDEDDMNQHHQHFAIDDDEDEDEEDDFEDFADFDDGEALANTKKTNIKKYKKKD